MYPQGGKSLISNEKKNKGLKYKNKKYKKNSLVKRGET